jgi:hypothetical protein
MQEWREIVEFPGYSVSSGGLIRNDATDRIMAQSPNTRGIATVGLTRLGVQYKRSVSVLVADAFILHAKSFQFNTTINLDGDRFNNEVSNLAWRPLWFARRYNQQFEIGPQGFGRPIEEVETGEQFANSWLAAITRGVLEREIVFSVMRRTWVFPIYRTFRVLD